MQKVRSFELLLVITISCSFHQILFLFNFPSRYSPLSLFLSSLEDYSPFFFLYSLFFYVFRSPLLHISLLIPFFPFTSDVSFLRSFYSSLSFLILLVLIFIPIFLLLLNPFFWLIFHNDPFLFYVFPYVFYFREFFIVS